MEEALEANSNTMEKHFHKDFRWMGNQGCGTKHNLEEFRNNWQLPLRAAFTNRVYKTDKYSCRCLTNIIDFITMLP